MTTDNGMPLFLTPDMIGGSREPLTMSSREIADLTGKEHKNVIRDVRVMLIGLYGQDQLERMVPEQYRNRHSEYVRENANSILNAIIGDGSKRSHDVEGTFPGVVWERDNRGYISIFRFDKSHTMTLVSGYDVQLRKKIVDRWIELEGRVANPVTLPDLSDPVVLTQLLMEHASKRIEAEKRAAVAEEAVQVAKPKTIFYDQFVNAEGLYGLQNAARVLSEPPNKFIGWLKQKYLFYQQGQLVARAEFRQQGIFEVKVTMVDDKARHRTFVTPKGIRYLAGKLNKSGDLFGRLDS